MVNAEARIKQHTSRRLKPGEMFSVELRATVYTRPETWQEALKRVSRQDGKAADRIARSDKEKR